MRTLKKVAGNWVCRGYSDFPVGGRDTLASLYGLYEPSALTTGTITSEAILTDGFHDYNSDVNAVTIPDGAVITQKRIFGDVTFAGTALLTDCLLVGGNNAITSGNHGVLDCTNTRTGQAVLKDCTIRVRKESDGRDCALGWQYRLERCNLSGGVDGAGIYNKVSSDANVQVLGCWIHDLAYTYPDRDHSDGDHCDCVAIQGSTNILVKGNRLDGTAHRMAGSGTYYTANPSSNLGDWPLLKGPGHIPGAGVIVSKAATVVGDPDSTVIIDGNYFHWGKVFVNIKSLAEGWQLINNKFSSIDAPCSNVNGTVHNGVALTFTYNSYYARYDNIGTTDIIGMSSGGVVTNTTNVWLDGANAGVAVNLPRASGIASDV